MTRDEVLDQALKAIEPETNWCGCTGAIQALKSKAPPASPEAAPAHEVMTDVHRLVDERDALRQQLEIAETRTAIAERDRAELAAERDAFKAHLDKAEADVKALESRVEHLTWEAKGSPMPGEEGGPVDGHPFRGLPGSPAPLTGLCAIEDCGRPIEEHRTPPWRFGPCRHCKGKIAPDPTQPGRSCYLCLTCAPESPAKAEALRRHIGQAVRP